MIPDWGSACPKDTIFQVANLCNLALLANKSVCTVLTDLLA